MNELSEKECDLLQVVLDIPHEALYWLSKFRYDQTGNELLFKVASFMSNELHEGDKSWLKPADLSKIPLECIVPFQAWADGKIITDGHVKAFDDAQLVVRKIKSLASQLI